MHIVMKELDQVTEEAFTCVIVSASPSSPSSVLPPPCPTSCPQRDCHLKEPDSDLPRLCLLQLYCGQLPFFHHYLAPQWS